MARPRYFFLIDVFIFALTLAMVSSFSCPKTCESEIKLCLYLKQVGGTPESNQATIISPTTSSFGTTIVNDWTIIDGPAANAKVIGYAQGIHVLSDQALVAWYISLNLVFQADRFNGSTLQVMGAFPPTGEWSIIGGTGELAMARGIIKHKIVGSTPNTNFRQLDIHAFYSNLY